MIGLLWAALQFLAPAFGSAFASAAGNQLGSRFADALIPEVKAAGVAPEIVARASQRQATPQDQLVLQPVLAKTFAEKPAVAGALSADVERHLPVVASQVRAIDAAVPPRSAAAVAFASGTLSVLDIDSVIQRTMELSDEHMCYWRDHICPVGSETGLAIVQYFESADGKETSMTRAETPKMLMPDGRLVPNETMARCPLGHVWKVFAPKSDVLT
jgi:hypothetical protein